MNKMKKLLALALASAMALSMLAGCSSKEEPAAEATTPETGTEAGTEVENTPYVPSITYEEVDLSTLTLQESEVQAVKWATEAEILALMDDGQFLPYHKSLIQLLFAMKDSRGAHVSKLG